ncbi:MAG: hypothetical protein LBK46_03050 [Oscillospiraceae bacterium]|nr:hypothetical protein [Oscillospiraceae bacterium]
MVNAAAAFRQSAVTVSAIVVVVAIVVTTLRAGTGYRRPGRRMVVQEALCVGGL